MMDTYVWEELSLVDADDIVVGPGLAYLAEGTGADGSHSLPKFKFKITMKPQGQKV